MEASHRKSITSNTKLPAHLTADCPALHTTERNGKTANLSWTNLQLPLYALAVRKQRGELPVPCYFMLGATAPNVGLFQWLDFSDSDLEAAEKCAEWIVGRIAAGVFWPPADKVVHDDFAQLSSGQTLEKMCFPPQLTETQP